MLMLNMPYRVGYREVRVGPAMPDSPRPTVLFSAKYLIWVWEPRMLKALGVMAMGPSRQAALGSAQGTGGAGWGGGLAEGAWGGAGWGRHVRTPDLRRPRYCAAAPAGSAPTVCL
jgi:hypothetical protein